MLINIVETEENQFVVEEPCRNLSCSRSFHLMWYQRVRGNTQICADDVFDLLQKLLRPVGMTSGDAWACPEANRMLAVDSQHFWGGGSGVRLGSPASCSPLNTPLLWGPGKYEGLLLLVMFLETFVSGTCGLAGVCHPAGVLIPLFQHGGYRKGTHLGCTGVYGGGAAPSKIHMDVRTWNWSHDDCYTLTFQWFWKQWPVQR